MVERCQCVLRRDRRAQNKKEAAVPAAVQGDLEVADQEPPQDSNSPTPTKKHRRTLSSRQGNAVFHNVRWLPVADWRPFMDGSPALGYLKVTTVELNERRAQAKLCDLAQKGKELSAEVRKMIAESESAAKKAKKVAEPTPIAPSVLRQNFGG